MLRFKSKKIARTSLPLVLSLVLSACGDGGGGNAINAQVKAGASAAQKAPSAQLLATSATPAAPVAPGLYLSEVAANYRGTDGVSWVELFNNSTATINLSDYRLRANGVDSASKALSANPITFDLPNVTIPAGGYFVVAGKPSSYLKDSDKSAYILQTVAATQANAQDVNYLPYWTDKAGFVELLRVADNSTADFVRFGSEQTKPTTDGAWSGDNVAAFPALANYISTTTLDPLDNFDRSIVRLSGAQNFAVSATKTDWTLVTFPTPGGPNDVPAGTVDSDNDGIPDTAKVDGGTFAGLDLYTLGARKGQRDLFLQVDYMTSNDPALSPRREALQKVVDAFQSHNIKIHFDAGNLFNTALAPDDFNLSGDVSHAQPFESCTDTPQVQNANCGSLYQYSSGSLDVRRKPVFRYMLMASSQNANGSSGSSGIAELPGNKFLVTLGQWGFANLDLSAAANKNVLVNYQAGTIMHEFGHTLDLHHGGFEDANYKPNYFSIMNYLYQLNGLPLNPKGMGPTQRWYYAMNTTGNSAVPGYAAKKMPFRVIVDGPVTDNFKIDYSNGSGAGMNQAALLESDNIGRGNDAGAYGDWNVDGVQQKKAYAFQLNGTGYTVIKDNDDWTALQLVLNSHSDVVPNANGAQAKVSGRIKPGRRYGTLVKEDAPPANLLQDLASMSRSAR
ncbi:lamin tail domain-containing protein [Collimonas arenae]|nr:lamin tail domain-containing protein [Collimonas arenae]